MSPMHSAHDLVVAIFERGRGERLCDTLQCGAHLNILLRGRGTARKKLLAYLGLDESEKDVLLACVPRQGSAGLIDAIAEKLQLARPGKGIAFAIPICGAGDLIARSAPQAETKRQEGTPMETSAHNLIIAIMNHGYADDVMDTARDAGATGGTILKAHGATWRQAEKFLGVAIQADKDLLMILADTQISQAILSAIAGAHGVGHDAHAIAFALPVSGVAGLAE